MTNTCRYRAPARHDDGIRGAPIAMQGRIDHRECDLADKSLVYRALGWWGGDRWQSLMGHMSHTIALERLGPWVTRRVLWRIKTHEKIVALSFDDGPHPEFTPAILDILEKHQLPATFFLVGNHVQQHPRVVQRLASGPHEIGNHTLSHRILPMLGDQRVLEEIRQAERLIREITGQAPRLLRPPMGLFSRRVVDLIEGSGYRTVIGDVYPRDPNRPGRERIYRRVVRRARPGSIIILHDGGNTHRVDRSQTVWATERIIKHLKAQGYRFVTISGLMDIGERSEDGHNGRLMHREGFSHQNFLAII